MFNVASNGNVGVKVENAKTSPVALSVNGAIQQIGFATPDTNGTYGGDSTEMGECDMTVQYQGCDTVINIAGKSDGNTSFSQATIAAKVHQQAAMGSAPIIVLQMNGVTEYLVQSDFMAVTTQNDGSATIVKLYVNIGLLMAPSGTLLHKRQLSRLDLDAEFGLCRFLADRHPDWRYIWRYPCGFLDQ